jgi:acetyltransferase-like isoleucine patch superfamily enzyme
VSFNETIVTADSTLAPYCEVRSHASVRSSALGRHSSLGRFSKLAWTDVGAFSMISWDVTIGAMPHRTDGATTHFFPIDPLYRLSSGPPLIEDYPRADIGSDVWIGCNAVILSGIAVGNGAIVAAGAVVTRDVGSFEVVAGVPARRVRDRVPPDTAARLERVAWWDWPDDVLRQHLALFRRPLDDGLVGQLESVAQDVRDGAWSSPRNPVCPKWNRRFIHGYALARRPPGR